MHLFVVIHPASSTALRLRDGVKYIPVANPNRALGMQRHLSISQNPGRLSLPLCPAPRPLLADPGWVALRGSLSHHVERPSVRLLEQLGLELFGCCLCLKKQACDEPGAAPWTPGLALLFQKEGRLCVRAVAQVSCRRRQSAFRGDFNWYSRGWEVRGEQGVGSEWLEVVCRTVVRPGCGSWKTAAGEPGTVLAGPRFRGTRPSLHVLSVIT